MHATRIVTRRRFLGSLFVFTSAGLIQACGSPPPAPAKTPESKPAEAAPATAPAKPAEAKPAETKPVETAQSAQAAPAAVKAGGTLVAGWDSDPGAFDNNV